MNLKKHLKLEFTKIHNKNKLKEHNRDILDVLEAAKEELCNYYEGGLYFGPFEENYKKYIKNFGLNKY